MSYALWMHGEKIGTTQFELTPGPRKRAGMFHPTPFGLTVLPRITAMLPALLDFGTLCQRNGIDTTGDGPDATSRALATFSDTPEGRRVLDAAQYVAALELRDPGGTAVAFDSIAVSDIDELAAAARRADSAFPTVAPPRNDPMRYLISVTLPDSHAGRHHLRPSGAHPPSPIS